MVDTSKRVETEGVTPVRAQNHVDPENTAVHGATVVPGTETESEEMVRFAGTEPETVKTADDPDPWSTVDSTVVGVESTTVDGLEELSMLPHPVACETAILNVPSGKSLGRAWLHEPSAATEAVKEWLVELAEGVRNQRPVLRFTSTTLSIQLCGEDGLIEIVTVEAA